MARHDSQSNMQAGRKLRLPETPLSQRGRPDPTAVPKRSLFGFLRRRQREDDELPPRARSRGGERRRLNLPDTPLSSRSGQVYVAEECPPRSRKVNLPDTPLSSRSGQVYVAEERPVRGRKVNLPDTPLSRCGAATSRIASSEKFSPTTFARGEKTVTASAPRPKKTVASAAPQKRGFSSNFRDTCGRREKWPERRERRLNLDDVDAGELKISRRPAGERAAAKRAAARPRKPSLLERVKARKNAPRTPSIGLSPRRPVVASEPVKKKDKVPPSRPIGLSEPPAPKPAAPLPLRAKIARAVICLAIVGAAIGFYSLWVRQTREETMPPMFMPQPYFYEEEQPVKALLLWHEKVLTAPASGTVQFTGGGKTTVVADNDVVATVMARGGTQSVRAPGRGYFVPALDGAEDDWTYFKLWQGSDLLPEAPQPVPIADLQPLPKNRAVGKLIALPQQPRAVFYVNLSDSLMKALERSTISIRRESRGPKWTAHVRVYRKYDGGRAKVVLDMPSFPLEMAASRATEFLVCSEEDSGLIVPDSSVTIRNGTYGVFELVGDQLLFRAVTGKPVKDGMFFVASGLSPGNPVMLDAANAEEKRVRLW